MVIKEIDHAFAQHSPRLHGQKNVSVSALPPIFFPHARTRTWRKELGYCMHPSGPNNNNPSSPENCISLSVFLPFFFFFKELYRHPTLSDAALLMICTRTCFFRIVISFMFALFPFLLFVSLIHARRGGKQNAGGDRFPLRRAELMCRVNCWIQLNSTRLHPLRVPPRASAWKSKPGE